MTTIRRWARVRALVPAAVVAAALAVAGRPGLAQQPTQAAVQDSAPLTLLFIVFPDTTSAQNAMTSLNTETGESQGYQASPSDSAQPAETARMAQNVNWIEPYYAVVSKDKSGNVTVQNRGKKGDTSSNARAEKSIDGVSTLLAQRPSSGGGDAAGAGASQAGISSTEMRDIQNGLQPGNTGLIIVVAGPMVDDVTSEMKQAHASGVYDAPLVVVPAQ